MENTIQLETQTKLTNISLSPQGILVVEFNTSSEDFDLEEAKDQLRIVQELTDQKPVPVLVDTTLSFQTPSPKAKELLASYPFKKAEAIVVKHLHQRITSTFFLKLSHSKFKHPVKLFTSKEKAMRWLEKQF